MAIITINTIEELQLIGNDSAYPLSGDYELGNDIDASNTVGWNAGAGFDPIGDRWFNEEDDLILEDFTGTFDGKGFTIDGLFINRPDEDNIGLFGSTWDDPDNHVIIKNVNLTNCSITGQMYVGGLVGSVLNENNNTTITNCHVSGTISTRKNEWYIEGLE